MLSPFHCKPQFLFLESVELCYFIPDCERTLYRKKPVGRGIIPGADIGTDKSVGRGKQFRCLQHGHLASRNAPQEECCFMALPQACRHACCSHFLSYTIMHVLISSCILGFLSAKPGRSGDVVMMRGSCTMMTSVTSVNYVMGGYFIACSASPQP